MVPSEDIGVDEVGLQYLGWYSLMMTVRMFGG